MHRPGKRSGGGGGGGIPDRWLDYNAVGKRLEGTRFIAFKVPLKRSLTRRLSASEVFGPWELLDALSKDHEELGLIVDLTFTTRYYQLQDVPVSLHFVKIFTAGHEVPRDDTILSFKRVVRRFLRENANNDKLIGVHCTHGLNRTGYLICRYLIDVDGMDPKQAVHLFNSSRGHDIERKNYLDDLQRGPKRSNEGMDEWEEEPQRGCSVGRPSSESEDREDRRDRRDRRDSEDRRDRQDREDRRGHGSDSWHHRSLPPRAPNHHSHHHDQQHHHHRHPPPHLYGGGGLLSDPPRRNGGLLREPPSMPSFHQHARAQLRPYQWAPPQPHPGGQWARPPSQEPAFMSHSRAPPPRYSRTEEEEEEEEEEELGRRHHHHHHRSHWTDKDEQTSHHHRHTHSNRYERY